MLELSIYQALNAIITSSPIFMTALLSLILSGLLWLKLETKSRNSEQYGLSGGDLVSLSKQHSKWGDNDHLNNYIGEVIQVYPETGRASVRWKSHRGTYKEFTYCLKYLKRLCYSNYYN